MRSENDARFAQERRLHDLRFACEHCGLWDGGRDACAHGYPTTEHRLACGEEPGGVVVFCKDFDLA